MTHTYRKTQSHSIYRASVASRGKNVRRWSAISVDRDKDTATDCKVVAVVDGDGDYVDGRDGA